MDGIYEWIMSSPLNTFVAANISCNYSSGGDISGNLEGGRFQLIGYRGSNYAAVMAMSYWNKSPILTANIEGGIWKNRFIRVITDSDLTPVAMTTTRTENPYVSAVSFGRVNARKIGPNLIWVEFNVSIDSNPLPKTSDFIEIGKINGISYVQYGIYINIPAQNGSGVICLTFTDEGILKILNSNEISQGSVSSFVRTSFVAAVNFS